MESLELISHPGGWEKERGGGGLNFILADWKNKIYIPVLYCSTILGVILEKGKCLFSTKGLCARFLLCWGPFKKIGHTCS